MDALEVYRFAPVRRLEEAYLAGDLAEADARVLLARKPGVTVRQVALLLKDWRSTKRFEAEFGASRRWGR